MRRFVHREHVRPEPRSHVRRFAPPKVRSDRLASLASDENDALSCPAKSPEQPPNLVNFAKNDVTSSEIRVFESGSITPKDVVTKLAEGVTIDWFFFHPGMDRNIRFQSAVHSPRTRTVP